ncbi:SDR family oxidoreductase [Virgibacillus sp. MSP4-1]|uniref:SDR family oxidoreductase n=1 Tax=Virgibacillus sp. MSP4-1 TaxID=2700081 RepID=UPI00039E4040|nr:SDR family oxidoreductase [Virgibacillus sp. MSP4-1]QHS23412.1 SDR family oxidoreductase [Virgibacillus sp. MSP4-1]
MSKEVVVITGAGSGLGASLARRYAEMGSHVCLLGRTKEKLEQAANTLTGNDYSVYPIDVSSKIEVTETFHKIKQDVGAVDVLINNAGLGAFDLAENITEESVHSMIDINLKGTIFCTQEVLPTMKDSNSGIIANIVSTAGLEGKVTESVYCASKFGVRGFTESLLAELKDSKIHVFGAYMGGMKTEFWDGIFEENEMEGLMDPEDITDIIVNNVKPRKNLNVDQVVIKNH